MIQFIKGFLSKHHENPFIKFLVIFLSGCTSTSLIMNSIEIFALPLSDDNAIYVIAAILGLTYAIQYLVFFVADKK